MTGQIVVVHLRHHGAGPARAVADADTAGEVACQVASGAFVRLFAAELVGTLREWANTLTRLRPSSCVLVGGAGTDDLTALLADLLAPVPAVRCTPASLRDVLAGITGYDPAPAAALYGSGVVSVAHAATVGLRVGDPTPALADLDLVGTRGVGPVEVPVRCDDAAVAWNDEGPWCRGLQERRASLARSGVSLRAVLPARALTPTVARALVGSAVSDVELTTQLVDDIDRRLRSAVAIATAAGLGCTVSLAPPVEADLLDTAEQVAAAVRAIPDLHLVCDDDHLERLAGHGALAGALPHAAAPVRVRRIRRERRERIERALAGNYLGTPLSHGVHDLWWEHPDLPSAHATWLSEVMATGGSVLVSGDARAGSTAAHVAVVDVATALTVTGWSETDTVDSSYALVPVIRTETDRDALLEAIDRARHHGHLDGPLFAPGAVIGATCRLGVGPCPGERGRALHVDSAGHVRAGWGGPVLGEIGTTWSDLRTSLRSHSGTGCGCRPPAWALGERPWTGRVLDAAAAMRQGVVPDDAVGVSGLGGPLHHGGDSAAWPNGVVLARLVDGEHLLWSRWRGTVARLPLAEAAVVEALLDLGEGAADHLRACGLPDSAVPAALTGAAAVVSRLSPPAQPPTATLQEAS